MGPVGQSTQGGGWRWRWRCSMMTLCRSMSAWENNSLRPAHPPVFIVCMDASAAITSIPFVARCRLIHTLPRRSPQILHQDRGTRIVSLPSSILLMSERPLWEMDEPLLSSRHVLPARLSRSTPISFPFFFSSSSHV